MTIPTHPTHRDHCRVCGEEAEIQWSLSLERVDGLWRSSPVCNNCKRLLIREATAEGHYIPFFAWEASQKEAAKRNESSKTVRQFVTKFGRKRDEKGAALKASLFQIAKAE